MTAEERARIEAECQRLSVAFAVYLDLRRYPEVARLFTADALYRPRERAFVGPEGVLRYLEGRPATRRSRHVITNQLVEVLDAGTARGVCFLTYYAHEGALPDSTPAPLAGPVLVGSYHDRYRLTDDGWKIAERIGEIAFEAAS